MCLIVFVGFSVCVCACVFLYKCVFVGEYSCVNVCSRMFVCMRVCFRS